MKTKPIYLEDPYVKEMAARILEVAPDQEGVWKLILDQTIFYPMGGGQPTDQGTMIFPDGSKGEVNKVLLQEGDIVHYVKTSIQPTRGMEVQGTIDWERRFRNMRVHSAAHVIDFSLYLMGYCPGMLQPMKGDHGKKAFITYQGELQEDIKEALQNKANELVEKGMRFSWSFEPLEKLEKEALYLQPGLPRNKPLRALRLEGVGTVADGGTIVASTQEVGRILITAIEVADGNTFVKYQVS
jgi:alanyl-tRNA synthetase